MSIRHVFGATAAAVLMFAMGASAKPAGQASREARHQENTQITLVGCLQREADYRKEHHSGRGGPVATGLGLKNEYVLVNAYPADSGANATVDCSAKGTGEAYELTGKRERDLAKFVGHPVEITGILKHARIDASGKATGGFDPIGQDLKLFEVNVTSFRGVANARAAAAEPAPAPESVVAQANPNEPAPQQRGTSGAQRELPKTAGPLPLTGLIGLLSFAGALGLRSVRRRQ
jgi:hypothetical protein